VRVAKVAGLMLVVLALEAACEWIGLGAGLGWPRIVGRALVIGAGAGAYYLRVERRRQP